ncbi:MAG: putative toxin-antitoxin system toxin component, PIN family [bacterium]
MARTQFEVLVSPPMLDEYSDVFLYIRTVSAPEVILLMAELRASSRFTQISGTLRACKDPDDDKFLETAVTGGADFLVTVGCIFFMSVNLLFISIFCLFKCY